MIKKAPTASSVRSAKQKAVGGIRKRCVKGKNCSATCISAKDDCLVELSEPVSAATSKVAKFVQDRVAKSGADQVVAQGKTDPSSVAGGRSRLEQLEKQLEETKAEFGKHVGKNPDKAREAGERLTALSQEVNKTRKEVMEAERAAQPAKEKLIAAAKTLDKRIDDNIASNERMKEMMAGNPANDGLIQRLDKENEMYRRLKDLPDEQKGALEIYGADGPKYYLSVNNLLRTGSAQGMTPEQADIARTVSPNLASFLEKIPAGPKPMSDGSVPTLKRAVSGQFAEGLKNLRPGQVIQDNGFGSYTSTDNRVVDQFLSNQKGVSNAIIQVRNSKARDVANLMNYNEGEHISLPGSRYRLVKVDPKGQYSRKTNGNVPVYTFEEID